MASCVTLCITLLSLSLTGQDLKSGKILTGIRPKNDPSQTYSLYLPKSYSTKNSYPILFGFSPNANGKQIVEIHQAAAERFGWIVMASETSSNASIETSRRAGRALWQEAKERFTINTQRLYATGLSGGAVVASLFSRQKEHTFTGLFLHARGSYSTIPKKPIKTFSMLLPGIHDFNFDESIRYLCLARKNGNTAHVLVQPRGHQWADKLACERALRYAELRFRSSDKSKPDAALSKLITEDFDQNEEELDGPFFLLAWDRLLELNLRTHQSHPTIKRFKRLKKKYKKRLKSEQRAWKVMSATCLFDAQVMARFPSIESLKAVDLARRDLAKRESGSTAMHVALISQKVAPLSFERVLPRLRDQAIKKAYEAYLKNLQNVGIDFVGEAKKLVRAKRYGQAVVALHHGLVVGAVNEKTLEASIWRSLAKMRAFKKLKDAR